MPLAAWTPVSVLMCVGVAWRICKHARRVQLRKLNTNVVDETCAAVARPLGETRGLSSTKNPAVMTYIHSD